MPRPTPRVYQINWGHGVVLDTLYLVKGGTELTGQNQTTYNLSATRVTGAPVVAVAPAVVASGAEVAAPVSFVDQLAEQLPHAQEWVLAPLDTPVPVSVQQTFATIDATLQAQAAGVAPADLTIYNQGWGVWRDLMAVWHERGPWLRRNYELHYGAGLPEAWRAAWAERVGVIRRSFEPSLAAFHEAVRLNHEVARVGGKWHGEKFAALHGFSGGRSAGAVAGNHAAPSEPVVTHEIAGMEKPHAARAFVHHGGGRVHGHRR